MLFLTIGILSTGFSFKNALESGLENSTPFDASAYMYINPEDKARDIEKSLEYIGAKFNKDDKVAYYNEYVDGTKVQDIISLKDEAEKNNLDAQISYIRISDYNKLRDISNEEPIELKENEVLITSNFSKLLPLMEKYMNNNDTINLGGKIYNIKNEKVIEENLKTDYMQSNILTVIVSDDLCNDKELYSSNVNVNFVGNDKDKRAADFSDSIYSYKTEDTDYDKVGFVLGADRNEVYEQNKGLTTTILFVGIYMGIVFLISSMAVLALQQLSEASDSIERYKSLKRLGASTKSINKTIFVQTLIYFSIPVALAVVHSVVGIKVANDFISMLSQPDIGGTSLITAGIFLIVYMIYFYITYSGYKNIVKNNI